MLSTEGQRGQSMLEFALALPILALLLMGSLALGRFAYDIQIVREAAYEGSKLGAVDRLAPPGQDQVAYTPSNEVILQWIRVAAVEGDPSINPHAIALPGDPQWSGGNAWEFDPNQQPQVKDHENVFGGISSFTTSLGSRPSLP
ncbi:MAG TPA: TadE/TadG family type IV pilus assembly protein, partial [Candidatus Dormibacteraeota bacterium]|nr:TadE/TadG family type IV pilus assembly protein [Candidatus Dormibacteraeota bacterium]